MALNADQYFAHLTALLPQGAAWPRDSGSVLGKTLRALAEEMARVDVRMDDLVTESDVRSSNEMLGDWERVLGLPDDCMVGQALSLTDRRRIAHQRLVEQGGQSAAYFVALAELLGEPGCTVDEFRPTNCNDDCNDALYSAADRFFWRVNVPHPAANNRLGNCNDDCNDALALFTPSLIECPINERKPAHTTVIFSYAP